MYRQMSDDAPCLYMILEFSFEELKPASQTKIFTQSALRPGGHRASVTSESQLEVLFLQRHNETIHSRPLIERGCQSTEIRGRTDSLREHNCSRSSLCKGSNCVCVYVRVKKKSFCRHSRLAKSAEELLR